MTPPLPWRADSWETHEGAIIHRVVDANGAEIARCATHEMADAMCWAALHGPTGDTVAELLKLLEARAAHHAEDLRKCRETLNAEVMLLTEALRKAQCELMAARLNGRKERVEPVI